jgi:hypothetical protein
MDIFFQFTFVLSIVYVVNQIFNIIKNILSEEPNRISYSIWEKISNYFFISYLISYIINFL